MRLRRPKPSLVRRLTIGFILANAVATLLFLLAVVYFTALIEEEEPPGPNVALAMLADSLELDPNGRVLLKPGARVLDFAQQHPHLWFVAEGPSQALRYGSIPAELAGSTPLPANLVQARYRSLGDDGPRGDAVTEEFKVAGQSVRVTVGGIVTQHLGFRHFLRYLWREDFFWFPLFTAIFNLAGAIVAIPIVLRALRPTARAAAQLDPADLTGRLPERAVVKELLPLVRAFNEALDRLAEAFERRRRFIADTAHELRTPLAVLTMHVDALAPGGRKPDVQRTVYRLSQMVGQMLDAERLTLGGRRHEAVDLVAIARAAVADAAPLAVSNGYELGLTATAREVVVRGDPHSIARALANLIGNAIAHGGGTGAIDVSVSAPGVVEVADEGPGVPVEARERIFEPFRRERWDKDGCGLGLHLVREIMQSHGGWVSLVGAGPNARFRLEFPTPEA